ncbi:hypothetical protein D3C85_1281190 [compost metagenome]
MQGAEVHAEFVQLAEKDAEALHFSSASLIVQRSPVAAQGVAWQWLVAHAVQLATGHPQCLDDGRHRNVESPQALGVVGEAARRGGPQSGAEQAFASVQLEVVAACKAGNLDAVAVLLDDSSTLQECVEVVFVQGFHQPVCSRRFRMLRLAIRASGIQLRNQLSLGRERKLLPSVIPAIRP